MSYEGLLFEKKDGIATVTLNSPDKLNAISFKMRDSLMQVIDDLGKDDSVKVVILTGAGRGFCAGADLSELAGGPRPEPSIYEQLQGVPRPSFFKLEKPVIAAVNGACVGAGLSLALTCDIRIASDKAKFGSAFIKLGAPPDNGMSYWLPKIIGHANALEFLLTGKIIMGTEAKQIGLVNQNRTTGRAGQASPHTPPDSQSGTSPNASFCSSEMLSSSPSLMGVNTRSFKQLRLVN